MKIIKVVSAEDLKICDKVLVPHLDCPIMTVKEVYSNESENGVDRNISLEDRTMKLFRYDDVLVIKEIYV